jgi:hypothetical protein
LESVSGVDGGGNDYFENLGVLKIAHPFLEAGAGYSGIVNTVIDSRSRIRRTSTHLMCTKSASVCRNVRGALILGPFPKLNGC